MDEFFENYWERSSNLRSERWLWINSGNLRALAERLNIFGCAFSVSIMAKKRPTLRLNKTKEADLERKIKLICRPPYPSWGPTPKRPLIKSSSCAKGALDLRSNAQKSGQWSLSLTGDLLVLGLSGSLEVNLVWNGLTRGQFGLEWSGQRSPRSVMIRSEVTLACDLSLGSKSEHIEVEDWVKKGGVVYAFQREGLEICVRVQPRSFKVLD